MNKIKLFFFAAFLFCLSASVTGQDIKGKLVAGYQGWFACDGDESPRNGWNHWGGNPPSAGNVHFDLYPDVREYTTTYKTNLANLGNGQPSKLFSSYDNQVVNKHCEWMRTYGIDCAALQRFGTELGSSSRKAHRDGVATKLKNSSEAYGRKFYIMYDITGWGSFPSAIKTDWTNTIKGSLNLLSSSAYAKEDNKPVVCIWGIGKIEDNPANPSQCLDVINWFKNEGCYVIIGIDKSFRDHSADWLKTYAAANMISPWAVGSSRSESTADVYMNNRMVGDFAWCKKSEIEYQPVVFPGFSWYNWKDGAIKNSAPRMHGDFMWRQFHNVKLTGISNVYVAMFDEYDEGSAIAKAAENASMKPTNQWFITLDYDGTPCSADFYLRLTGDGARMIKGQIPLTLTHPTPHIGSIIPTGNLSQNSGPVARGGVRLVKSGLTLQYRETNGRLSIYRFNGVKVMDVRVTGDGEADISRLSPGAYVAVAGKEQLRFLMHAQ